MKVKQGLLSHVGHAQVDKWGRCLLFWCLHVGLFAITAFDAHEYLLLLVGRHKTLGLMPTIWSFL